MDDSIPEYSWIEDGFGDGSTPIAALELDADVGDVELARSIVLSAHERHLQGLSFSRDTPEKQETPAAADSEDSSFLGQLGLGEEGSTLAALSDVRTLISVVHAGTLRQRRAATVVLGNVLAGGERLSSSDLKSGLAALSSLRDEELVYERYGAMVQQSGSAARAARAERERLERAAARVLDRMRAYWRQTGGVEPLGALAPDLRVEIFAHARHLPDEWIAHISAILEGADSNISEQQRLRLLSLLRHAADARLTSTLRVLLEDGNASVVAGAAQALGRIESDPRVAPGLRGAFGRAVDPRAKATLAGALGAHGDARGADYVRSLLDDPSPKVLRAALEALETVGDPDDIPAVVGLFEHENRAVLHGAVKCLARIGDARAVVALRELLQGAELPSTRATVEDGLIALGHRLELRGEEVGAEASLPVVDEVEREDDDERVKMFIRVRSWFDYFWGITWLGLGSLRRAETRFELAAARRPRWCVPLISLANALARSQRWGRALAQYRRALDVDRRRVERNPITIGSLARAFLKRAHQLEGDGRREIALGLLEEAINLDLRRAPSAVRFELQRRHERLRSDD